MVDATHYYRCFPARSRAKEPRTLPWGPHKQPTDSSTRRQSSMNCHNWRSPDEGNKSHIPSRSLRAQISSLYIIYLLPLLSMMNTISLVPGDKLSVTGHHPPGPSERQILSLSAGAGHGSLKREKTKFRSSPSVNTRFLPLRFPGVAIAVQGAWFI